MVIARSKVLWDIHLGVISMHCIESYPEVKVLGIGILVLASASIWVFLLDMLEWYNMYLICIQQSSYRSSI